MLRRYFVFQMLLGLLLSACSKIGISNSQKSSLIFDLNNINPQIKPILIFVATNGNDRWSGRYAVPTEDNSDGPFATLSRAQAAIKTIKKRHNGLNRPIEVVFSGGTYRLTESVVFTPEDSGTKSFPITYTAAPQQQVTISGGKVITGWRETQINDRRLWIADLPPAQKANFQHLWVNGKRRIRARYPSRGYLKIDSVSKGGQWYEGDRSFNYQTEDVPQDIELKGGEAVVFNRWVESRLPIDRVDRSQNTLYFDKQSVFKLTPGDLYYLENKFEFLDTPGEWYLDRQQSRLYYLPLPSEAIASAEIVAPVLDTLIRFKGDGSKNLAVSHLKFDNLIFAHTDWHLPPTNSGYNQNAWGVDSAIVADGIEDCQWNYCTWKHLGGYGIELFRHCQHNQIASCSFFDLGAGGIKLGERKVYRPQVTKEAASHHNIITRNHIYDGGKFFPSAIAIGVASSHHNSISYNHIHNFYYTAIGILGHWGFELTQAHHNSIEHNYIHHIGKLRHEEMPILSDMGGIYIVGNQPETMIRHNKVHDIYGVRYGGWGIYLDQGSSKILVEDNLVYQTSHGGFSQHYGRENVIRNNIFAFGKKTQIHRNKVDLEKARAGDFVSFYFVNNIVYWQEGELIIGLRQLKPDYQSQAVFKDNIYWKVGSSKISFGGLEWQEWKKGDRNSQVIDPLFVAPQRGDFRLKANSTRIFY